MLHSSNNKMILLLYNLIIEVLAKYPGASFTCHRVDREMGSEISDHLIPYNYRASLQGRSLQIWCQGTTRNRCVFRSLFSMTKVIGKA